MEGAIWMSDEFQGAPPAPPAYAPAPGAGPASDNSKILAGLGYLTGVVALVAILIEPYKDEKWVRLHAIQALALWAGWIVASILFRIPLLGWVLAPVLWLILAVLSIMGAIKAFGGEWWEMPVVHPFIKAYV
jgi:uncharacterized membrane protein